MIVSSESPACTVDASLVGSVGDGDSELLEVLAIDCNKGAFVVLTSDVVLLRINGATVGVSANETRRFVA